jgi:hypothetical protein
MLVSSNALSTFLDIFLPCGCGCLGFEGLEGVGGKRAYLYPTHSVLKPFDIIFESRNGIVQHKESWKGWKTEQEIYICTAAHHDRRKFL